jgi:5-methyltetrahydropteroyltriglutamate--homocysteine methyltransferase
MQMAVSAPHDPPFRAEHVGSLLRPASLIHLRKQHASGRVSADELREAEDAAIRRLVSQQENAGLESITDGEIRREDFYSDYFVRGLGGVELREERQEAGFVDQQGGIIPIPFTQVVSRLRWRKPIYADHFRYLRSLTRGTAKITIPCPMMLYAMCGETAIRKAAYPEMDLFWADVSDSYQKEMLSLYEAGCRYLQIDDPSLSAFCSDKYDAMLKSRGNDPRHTLHELYPEIVNRALANRPSSMHVAMHVCRGNYHGGWFGEGGYEAVAEVLFNYIQVDSYFLEYDTDRAGGFEPLRFVPKNKTIVLGLVSSKLPSLESKDMLKRRIEEASRYIDIDQLSLSPQCGFANSADGNPLNEEEQFAKLRLVVEVANEVWGHKSVHSAGRATVSAAG